jgi:hypothetical protein
MERDEAEMGDGRGLIEVGATAARAKMFARVGEMMLVAGAVPPASADLTASYRGTVAVNGTAEATAVSAALTQAWGALRGTIVLGLAHPALGGRYTLRGEVRGRRLVLRGRNRCGARLCWRGRLGPDGVVGGGVRIALAGVTLGGTLVLVRRRAGGGGKTSFRDTIVLPLGERDQLAG